MFPALFCVGQKLPLGVGQFMPLGCPYVGQNLPSWVGQKLPLMWVKSCRVRILLLRILGDGRFLASRSVIESRLELKQKNYFAA